MTDQEFKNLLESEQVLYGKGAPSSAQGKELDLYIDTDTRKFYRKYLGSWTCNADLVLGPLFTTGKMSWDQLKVDASLAAFFEIVTESDGDRVFKLKPPANGGNGRTYYLGETNGVADWRDPAADFAAWLESLKNKPNGVPGLDKDGYVNPDIVFPPGYRKDVNGGIAGLDDKGKLKYSEMPNELLNDVNSRAKKDASNLDDNNVEAWKKKLGIDWVKDPHLNGDSGYMYLPGGVILQWGRLLMQGGGNAHIQTFPIAFTQEPYSITIGISKAQGDALKGHRAEMLGSMVRGSGHTISKTQVDFEIMRLWGDNGGSQPDRIDFYWMALGK